MNGLTQVTGIGGFDWMPLVIFAVTAIAIAGLWIWHKRNPKQQDETLNAAHTALSSATSSAHDLVRELLARLNPSDVMPAAVQPIALGKANTPGTFTIQVTGDPAKDWPAINKQYFG